MLRMRISDDTKSPYHSRERFAGHFAEKAQLILVRRTEITAAFPRTHFANLSVALPIA